MEDRLLAWRRLLDGYIAAEVSLTGDGRRLDAAVHSELGEDILDVGPQRADSDVHLGGHLPGVLACGDPAQHLFLPGRERERRLRARRSARRHRVECWLASGDRAQGFRDLADAPVLAEKPGDAKLLGLSPESRVTDIRDYENGHARAVVADLADEPQAVFGLGEMRVQHAYVGPVMGDRGGTAHGGIGSDRGHLTVTGLQCGGQRLAQYSVAIADDKTHHPPYTPAHPASLGDRDPSARPNDIDVTVRLSRRGCRAESACAQGRP